MQILYLYTISWQKSALIEVNNCTLSPTKNNVQSTVKWADIEKGIPPEQHGKIFFKKFFCEILICQINHVI